MSATPRYRRILLKLSGELLAGEAGHGISDEILAGIAGEIRDVHALCGTGNRVLVEEFRDWLRPCLA